MSKSKLRSKDMQSLYKGYSLFASKINDPVRNHHRQDEIPKNKPSRFITTHCSSTKVNGYRIQRVSGAIPVRKAAIAG